MFTVPSPFSTANPALPSSLLLGVFKFFYGSFLLFMAFLSPPVALLLELLSVSFEAALEKNAGPEALDMTVPPSSFVCPFHSRRLDCVFLSSSFIHNFFAAI